MSATSDGCEADPPRHELLAKALALSYISVFWGAAAGAWAVVAGLLARSLGVLGLGLNVLADVAGSIGLVWRFGIEQRDLRRHLGCARGRQACLGWGGLGHAANRCSGILQRIGWLQGSVNQHLRL
jgi:hypothetical protein